MAHIGDHVGPLIASIAVPPAQLSMNPIGPGNGDGIQRIEGTNVIRVPFGVRHSRRSRPARPEHWATLVLSFQSGGGGGGPTPPQAA